MTTTVFSQRPNLALVHGWGLGRAIWEPLLPALAADWRVHLVDLPGYGHRPLGHCSLPDEHADFEAAAHALVATLPRPVTLCGWSLGGMLVLRAALLAPDVVPTVVLVGTTLSFVTRPDWNDAQSPDFLDSFAQHICSQPEKTLRRFIHLLNRGDGLAKDLTRLQRNCLASAGQPSAAVLADGLRWLREVDLRPLACSVTVPCLLVHGSNDTLNPLAAAFRMSQLIRQARLEVFPECGHAPFHHDGARFCQTLAKFRNDLAG